MLEKKSKKILFIICSVVITGLVIIIFFLFVSDLPGLNSLAKQTVLDPTNSQPLQSSIVDNLIEPILEVKPLEEKVPVLSIRLKIPKIDVDTAIESVGLTPQGAVDVPKDPNNAAWYNLGPYPGDVGNAVITGHFGRWKNGSGSVFDNLNKLSKGDSLSISDGETIINFVVSEVRMYNEDENVPNIFISNDANSHLNLITCDGVWNESSGTFSKRLVVFADKE